MDRHQKNPIFRKWWFWAPVVIVAGIIANAMGGCSSSTSTGQQPDEKYPPVTDTTVVWHGWAYDPWLQGGYDTMLFPATLTVRDFDSTVFFDANLFYIFIPGNIFLDTGKWDTIWTHVHLRNKSWYTQYGYTTDHEYAYYNFEFNLPTPDSATEATGPYTEIGWTLSLVGRDTMSSGSNGKASVWWR